MAKKEYELSELINNPENGFAINGINAGDNAGISVTSAGDMNGDGYEDIVVGAYLADPGGRKDAGQVYVIFGGNNSFSSINASSLDGTNGFVINGIETGDNINGWLTGDQAGVSVSSAGDLNLDGYDDIIVGSLYAGSRLGFLNKGQVYVVFGRLEFSDSLELSSMDGKNGFIINGVNFGDDLGVSVSGLGDVNKDGKKDFIVGSAWANAGDIDGASQSYVIYGKTEYPKNIELSSLSSANGFTINGVNERDHAGYLVSDAGDFNKDGISDIAIGAPGFGSSGRVYVVFGKEGQSRIFDLSSIDGSNGFYIDGLNGGNIGYSIDGNKDLNRDGFSDLIMGDPFSDRAYVIFGHEINSQSFNLDSLDGRNGYTINGKKGTSFGRSVSSILDVNEDYGSEILISAPLEDSNGKKGSGSSYIVSSQDQYPQFLGYNSSNIIEVKGMYIGDTLGVGLSSIGDFNGDGKPDFLLGAPGADPYGKESAGQAYVIYSSNFFPTTTTTTSSTITETSITSLTSSSRTSATSLTSSSATSVTETSATYSSTTVSSVTDASVALTLTSTTFVGEEISKVIVGVSSASTMTPSITTGSDDELGLPTIDPPSDENAPASITAISLAVVGAFAAGIFAYYMWSRNCKSKGEVYNAGQKDGDVVVNRVFYNNDGKNDKSEYAKPVLLKDQHEYEYQNFAGLSGWKGANKVPVAEHSYEEPVHGGLYEEPVHGGLYEEPVHGGLYEEPAASGVLGGTQGTYDNVQNQELTYELATQGEV